MKNLKLDKAFPHSERTQIVKQYFAKINDEYDQKRKNFKNVKLWLLINNII